MTSKLYQSRSLKAVSVPQPIFALSQVRNGDADSCATAIGRFAHDFSKVPVFASVRTPGPRARYEHTPDWFPNHTRAGSGEVDAETASDAGSAKGPADAGPANEAGPAPDATPSPREEPPGESGDQDRAIEPEACTIDSKTAVHAPDGTPDTRTTIGACETVLFRLGGQVADWTSSSGWPQSRAGRARYEWAAPEQTSTSTITATVPATGQRCSLEVNVIAPESVQYRNVNELNYPAGQAGAGMELTLHLRPRNVNFGWVAIREDDVAAAGIRGYFTRFTAAQLRHAATPDFARIGWNNGLAPNAAGDPQGDTASTVQGFLPQPFAAGTYQWNIPVRYRCFNSTGNGRIFTRTQQRFNMENDGTMIVTKGGARVERTP